MKKHVKPTQEELDAAALKAAEEAEAIKKKEDEENAGASASPSEQAPSASPSQDVPSPSPSQAAPSPSPSPEPYKKKAIEQARENIVLHGREKKMNEAIDSAAKVGEPTDEEMKIEYPEWEDMTETEKKTARKTVKTSNQFSIINSARQEGKNVDEWNGKVDAFVADPKSLITYPELEGKTDDFLLFATRPTRVGVPFDILVSAFLHDATKTMKTKKKQMFEPGSGGLNDKPKPKSGKISLEQAKALRESNYPKYVEYLKAGKIDNAIE